MAGFASLCGCNKTPPPITKRTYTIPTVIVKQNEEQALVDKNLELLRKRQQELADSIKPEPQRMLAALVPQSDTDFFWTFKVQGKPEELEKIKPEFLKLLQSLQWEPSGGVLPVWQFPEGSRVKAQEDNFGRVATILLSNEFANLQIAVAKFTNSTDWEKTALSNLNRWRGQLRLEPINIDGLDAAVEKIPFKGGEAFLMDAQGTATAQPGMSPPMTRTPPPEPKPEPTPNNSTNNTPGNDKGPPSPQEARNLLTYDVPAAWQAKQASSFRVASFDVSADGKKADVALSVFSTKSPEMGKLLPNVNRWRGELGLKPATESELPEQTSELKVDAGNATIFTATGTRQDAPTSTLAAMLIRGDLVWFVKLQGDATLVSQQRPAFEEFLKSLKFNE